MKKHLFFLLASASSAVAFAQPVLDGGSAPVLGTSYEYLQAYFVAVNGTGPGQTWDLTFTGITGGEIVDFIDPASSIDGASFPACDVVYSTPSLEYYTDVQPTGLYEIGLHAPHGTETWTDPFLYLAFPCALDTSWTDDYTTTYDYLGDTYNGSGTGTFTALGYGNVQLPWGVVTNVIRVDQDRTYTESGSGDVLTSIAHYVYFFKPGFGHFVARTTVKTDSLNGAPLSYVDRMDYIDINQLGLTEHAAQSLGVQVIYDALLDEATLLISATGETGLDMLDAQGRIVLRKDLGDLAPGIHRIPVDVHAWPAGMYMATVRNTRGESGSRSFVIAR